jgi:hypothetical protein
MSTRRAEIRKAIETMHHCEARHVESVAVFERTGEKAVWEGVVEVFDLSGSHEAPRCYAWIHGANRETEYVIVLHHAPVTSPVSAVRSYIMSLEKRTEPRD